MSNPEESTYSTLQVVDGGVGTSEYVLQGPQYTIGRDETAQIVVAREDVSRLHAVIRQEGITYVLVDASRYGTWVNGVKLARGETVLLSDGDEIGLSNPTPVFRFCDPNGTAPPSAQLVFDQHTHRYLLGTTVLSLTPQEQLLLDYLVLHRGAVCSHQGCGEAIWGKYQGDMDVTKLYRVIADLRRKLRTALAPSLQNDTPDFPILNFQKQGYVLAL